MTGDSVLVATQCVEPNTCDDYSLKINRGSDSHAILTFNLASSGDVSDLIFDIYPPGCSSAMTVSRDPCVNHNTGVDFAKLANIANGTYLVRVLCGNCVNAGYTMTAKLARFLPKVIASKNLKMAKSIGLKGYSVGEPGIATDGKGTIVVVSLTGGPAGLGLLNSVLGGDSFSTGIPTWVSHDYGKSWTFKSYGSNEGGWDTDVAIAPDDGTIYIADLEVAGVQVCRSDDHGLSFHGVGPIPDPNGCSAINTGQTSPSDDRQWFTADKGGRVYISDHEFNTSIPTIMRSDNKGDDLFTAGPCGPIITDPAILANSLGPLGGTLVSRPVLDRQGNIYMLFTTPTQASTAQAVLQGELSGTYSNVYMAISKDHCQTWKDVTIFDGSTLGTNTVQFGNIFNNLSIDGADNLYAVAGGYVGKTAPSVPRSDLWLFSSKDHGLHWTGPTKINAMVGANMLPGITGGKKAGQLAVGFFRTSNNVVDPNDTTATWAYTIAESYDAFNGSKAHWAFTDIDAGRIFHAADICNLGIFCTVSGGNRDLADFTSATIDRDGCPMFVFQGTNPSGQTHFARQTGPCFASSVAVEGTKQTRPAVKPTAADKGATLPATGVGDMATVGILLLLAAALTGRRAIRLG